jgi:hypothetical protein
MSAAGQSRRFGRILATSGLPLTPDIEASAWVEPAVKTLQKCPCRVQGLSAVGVCPPHDGVGRFRLSYRSPKGEGRFRSLRGKSPLCFDGPCSCVTPGRT